MKKTFLILILSLTYLFCNGQIKLTLYIKDSVSTEPVIQALVNESLSKKTVLTDLEGGASIILEASSKILLTIKAVSYNQKSIQLSIMRDTTINIVLKNIAQNVNEIIVEANRTQSRLEDNPTKVEVLGFEEMQEEGGLQPGGLNGLINDFSGTQVQQVSSTNGNSVLRLQGLDGRYTQFLQDGMPLYGG